MILDAILEHKRAEVDATKRRVGEAELRRRIAEHPAQPGRFRNAIDPRCASDGPPVRLIAEVKKASPSKGVFRADFDPLAFARAYDASGASALSVLTDERFFGGSLDTLRQIAGQIAKPLLRKDFIVDPYQLLEASAAGASAVLLIVAALGDRTGEFATQAADLGLDALVEVHDEAELDTALAAGAAMVGVNSRNLSTFDVDLGVCERLARHMPAGTVKVAESGIRTRVDVKRLEEAGFQAILVGETLVRSDDPAAAIRALLYD